ncbi:hypothetical protein OZ410_05985 [Robiginitalea sp. M366]|nr:hypothetical protein [Robiginitalea aestuariiviva]MDG1571858.1 hypothetical protein [Robiginitalea aestuariiviva]
MRAFTPFSTLSRLARFVYRFRTAVFFWMYVLAMMLYAYKWMPA